MGIVKSVLATSGIIYIRQPPGSPLVAVMSYSSFDIILAFRVIMTNTKKYIPVILRR